MNSEDRMTIKTRRRYTERFKVEAVRVVRDSARPVAQVARYIERCSGAQLTFVFSRGTRLNRNAKA